MGIKSIKAGLKQYRVPKNHISNFHKIFYAKKKVPIHDLNTSSRVAFRIMRNDDVAMGVANALMLQEGVNYSDTGNTSFVGKGGSANVMRSGIKTQSFTSDRIEKLSRVGKRDTQQEERSFGKMKFKAHRHNDSVRKFLDLLGRQKKGEHALRTAELFEKAGYIPNTSNFNTLMHIAMLKNRKNLVLERQSNSTSTSYISPSKKHDKNDVLTASAENNAASTSRFDTNLVTGPPPTADLLNGKDDEAMRRVKILVEKIRPAFYDGPTASPTSSDTITHRRPLYAPSEDLGEAVTLLWDSVYAVDNAALNDRLKQEQKKRTIKERMEKKGEDENENIGDSNNTTDLVQKYLSVIKTDTKKIRDVPSDGPQNNIYNAASAGHGWAITLLLYDKMMRHKKHADNQTLSYVLGAYKRGGLWAHCINLFIAMIREGGGSELLSPQSSANIKSGPSEATVNANTNFIIPPVCFSFAMGAARQCPDYQVALEVFNIGVRAASVGIVSMSEGVFITLLRCVRDAQISSAVEIRIRLENMFHANRKDRSPSCSESPASSATTANINIPKNREELETEISKAVNASHNQWADYAIQVVESIPPPLLRITTINTLLNILCTAGRSADAVALVGKIGAARILKIKNIEQILAGETQTNKEIDNGKYQENTCEGKGASIIDNLLQTSLSDAQMAEQIKSSGWRGGFKKENIALRSEEEVDGDTDLTMDITGKKDEMEKDIIKSSMKQDSPSEEKFFDDYFFSSPPDTDINNRYKNKILKNDQRDLKNKISFPAPSQTNPTRPSSSLSLANRRYLFDLTLSRMTPTSETMTSFHHIMSNLSEKLEKGGVNGINSMENASQYRSFLLVNASSVKTTPDPNPFTSADASPDDYLFTVFNWCRSLALPVPAAVLTHLLLTLYRRGLNKSAEALVASIVRDSCMDPGNTMIPLKTLYTAIAKALLAHPNPTVAEKLLLEHEHRVGALINPITEGFGDFGDDAGKSQWIFEPVRYEKKLKQKPEGEEEQENENAFPTSSDSLGTPVYPKIAVVDANVLQTSNFSSLFSIYDRIVVSFSDLVRFSNSSTMVNKESSAFKGTMIRETKPRVRFQRWLDGHEINILTPSPNSAAEKSDDDTRKYSRKSSDSERGKTDRDEWDIFTDDPEAVEDNTSLTSTNNSKAITPFETRLSKLMLLPYSHQIYANKYLADPPGGYASQARLRLEAAKATDKISPPVNEIEANTKSEEEDDEDVVIGIRGSNGIAPKRVSSTELSASLHTTDNSDHIKKIKLLNPPPPLSSFLGIESVAPSLATALMLATLNKNTTASSTKGENVPFSSNEIIRGEIAELSTRKTQIYREAIAAEKKYKKLEEGRTFRNNRSQQQQVAKPNDEPSGEGSTDYLKIKRSQVDKLWNEVENINKEIFKRQMAPNVIASVDLFVGHNEDKEAASAWLKQITTDKTLVHVKVFNRHAVRHATESCVPLTSASNPEQK